MADELATTEEVIVALGGVSAVAELTGRRYSAAHNWKTFKSFPANTYVVMTAALEAQGKRASPALWGMREPEAAS